MAVTSSAVTVATTATLLGTADADGTSICVAVPTGGSTIYVGGSTVTTAAGFPVVAGSPMSFDLDPSESLYGIIGASTQEVRVIKNRTA